MKIVCHVQATESLKRIYEIEVGNGTQFISWLAMTACLQFGQEHYPSGIYVPTLLTKMNDEGDSPHPRNRIKEELQHEDHVVIQLKDRGQTYRNKEEDDWYMKAFGVKRNLMQIKINCVSQMDGTKWLKAEFAAHIKYHMYEEMASEFKDRLHQFAPSMYVPMPVLLRDPDCTQFEDIELDLPYGTYECEMVYRTAGADENEEAGQWKPCTDKFKEFTHDNEPKPISRAEQTAIDEQEEKENKDREAEARLAQKKLEEEKARLRIEQQQQILKQEQNSAKLKIYFRAMNLSFHKHEEDFNASMSFLSIYHLELMENFKYYVNHFAQVYENRKENEMIVLQGFFHFLKLMKLASSPQDIMQLFAATLQEIDGVMMPVEETLNIKNGLNYAQFLEAILRIAYLKSENDQIPYKAAIEQIFQEADINITKRHQADSVLVQVYNEETADCFMNFSELLQAVFSKYAINRDATYIEMQKDNMINLLKDTGIVAVPKAKKVEEKKEESKRGGRKGPKPDKEDAKEKEEEKKEEPVVPEKTYSEADAMESIAKVHSFDEGSLDFFNFLECLVRISRDYPFMPEQEAVLTAPEMRLRFLCEKIDDKYNAVIGLFKENREQIEQLKLYQPRVVVDDEEEDMSDDSQ